jgi:hypothetical protein
MYTDLVLLLTGNTEVSGLISKFYIYMHIDMYSHMYIYILC